MVVYKFFLFVKEVLDINVKAMIVVFVYEEWLASRWVFRFFFRLLYKYFGVFIVGRFFGGFLA